MAPSGFPRVIAIVVAASLTPACTLVLPLTLTDAADRHNRRAAAEAARTGGTPDYQSVVPRAIGGLVAGAMIDGLLVLGLMLATTNTH